jgi:hypothetical protein
VKDAAISLEELKCKMQGGSSVEEIAKVMDWMDFEGLVSEIFSANGFRTFRNIRFTSKKRRFEVDVVALERPRVVAADCKHWGLRLGKSSQLRSAAMDQLRRAVELSCKMQELPGMDVGEWAEVRTTPILVTLYQERIQESSGVLVVPFFQLNSFVDQLRNGMFDSMRVKIQTLYSWNFGSIRTGTKG